MASEYCTYHFEELAHALRYRGLGHLIKPENAATFAVRWLHGISASHEFDPLVVASFEIRAKCTQQMVPETGKCPLCAADYFLPGHDIDEVWINNVSNLMLNHAKAMQLTNRR